MKVILTDNYDRDETSDYLIAEGLTLEDAKKLADKKNASVSPNGPDYFMVVADDYKLKEGLAS